jgi:hypothetical protein
VLYPSQNSFPKIQIGVVDVIRFGKAITMDPLISQNQNKKNIGLSILAGVGFAVGVFLASTYLTGIAIYTFWDKWGSSGCFETCAFMIIGFSPIVGLVIALVGGIAGGRRIHKRLSAKK